MENSVKGIATFIKEARNKKEQEENAEGIGILDQILNSESDTETLIDEFTKEFIRPNGPCIYAFITDKVNDAVKVGYTDQHPEKRIAQWKEKYGKNEGEVTCIGYWSSEEFTSRGERVFFWDHAVHKKLSGKKFKQLTDEKDFMASLTDAGKNIANIHFSREFFTKYKVLWDGTPDPEDREELSAELLRDLIAEMKHNIQKGTPDFKTYTFDKEGNTSTHEADALWGAPDTYTDTSLQKKTIEKGVEAIKAGKKNLLMAAVMRFGKTHATYEIIKKAGLKRVIVCSAKADVRASWRNDINHKDFYDKFVFVEVKDAFTWKVTAEDKGRLVTKVVNIYEGQDPLEDYKDRTIIYFFTLHDLGGSIGKLKEKHKGIFDKEFDLMIVDETHYGSHANTFGDVTKLGREEIQDDEETDTSISDEQEINKQVQDRLKGLKIKYKAVLQVSGTPYYILASNEMIKDTAEIISDVSYSDMLKARDEWLEKNPDEDPSKSPYFGIPTLHKIGLRLTKECRKALKDKSYTDNLTELFKTKNGKFIYEKAIRELVRALFGDGKGDTLAFLKNKTVEGDKVCRHTMMVLPRIAACAAMEKLLNEMIGRGNRKVFNIVGAEGKIQQAKDVDDLNRKLEELDEKGHNSIVLTCVRFLTGVSMPLIDSMIYLKNANSPQEYDQNIFRLCTRHVKTVKNTDSEFTQKKVNMKENVYLIDFNIGNMMRMVANSARMKAAAEGNPTTERIKELMKQDLDTTPIFCESSDEIIGKMKKIDSKDMMEIYTNYNKNKSIADIVNDEIDLFDNMFNSFEFQEVMREIDIEGDKSKNGISVDQDSDAEEIDLPDDKKSLSDFAKDKIDSHIGEETGDKKELKKIFQLTKEKFKAITKALLYCNICLDEPCSDLDEMMKRVKSDKEFKTMIYEFNVPLEDFYRAYKMMSTGYKQAYNGMLTRMVLLAQDTSKEGYEKFMTALKGLGRIDKNEVITPETIVDKMIGKLDESEYEKAESILIVNDKQGEFFYGLHKKFDGKYDDKIKIVPSSQVGRHLTIKALKTLGVKNYRTTETSSNRNFAKQNIYINDIIIDLEDYDKSGKIDVKDFLDMTNEEILKKNGGERFSILIMNPPYDKSLHLKFLEKAIKISDKVINISPVRWLQDPYVRTHKKHFVETVGDNIIDLETFDQDTAAKLFNARLSFDLGIYICSEDHKDKKFDIDDYSNTIDGVNVKTILDKIKEGYSKSLDDACEWNKNDGWRVRVDFIRPLPTFDPRSGRDYKVSWKGAYQFFFKHSYVFYDGKRDGKWWSEFGNKNQFTKKPGSPIPLSVGFETETEAKNFEKSLTTVFMQFIKRAYQRDVNVPLKDIPFMGDYSEEWTDERFKKHFKLSDNEWETINNIMKKYIND